MNAVAMLVLMLAAGASGDDAYSSRLQSRADSVLARELRAAEIIESRLRPRLGFARDASKAPVRIVITNTDRGLHEVSLVAWRDGPAQWREERVELAAGDGDYARAVVSGASGVVPPGGAVRLEKLLRDPALYREAAHPDEACDRQGVITISITFEESRHAAVLDPCLRGLTGEVVRVLDSETGGGG